MLPYHRIVIVGVSGAGKSTLAENLAAAQGAAFIELDALYWEPNWIPAPEEVFLARVDAATRKEQWAAAGNYRLARPLTWGRAQALVWLDYSFATVFWRLFWRTVQRSRSQELLWGTNREHFSTHLKLWSSDSLFNWLIHTYRRRKREIPQLLALPEYAHLQVFHLRQPDEETALKETCEGQKGRFPRRLS